MSLRIYLAGPEVFLPQAVEIGRRKKALCAAFGFEGLYPFDNELPPRDDQPVDRLIYAMNIAMIRRSDAIIANLTPFRGVSGDVGTVFELGVGAGLGKSLFGYTNHVGSLFDRVRENGPLRQFPGGWRDLQGFSVEDYGNADNLMIDCSLALGGHPIVRPSGGVSLPLDDLGGFETCLEMLKAGHDAADAIGARRNRHRAL